MASWVRDDFDCHRTYPATMNWLDMTKEEQKALARTSVAERRTLMERWGLRQGEISPGRSERSRLVASFIPVGGCCVVDVGCGSMRVEAYLPPGTRYIPVDVAKRDERTVIVDVDTTPLPDLGADVVVALGLLEYLNDVPAFLRQVHCNAVITYAPYEHMPNRDRAASGWKNSYTVASLSALVEASGFEITDLIPAPGKQMIWNLKRPSP
jgi:hypothetical protein